jgi:L-threonylcarbamoyladenylate synthase
MARARVLRLAENPPEVVAAAFVTAATAGELLIFPTDTVYGLGARADSAPAVAAVFEAKRRPADLALPVLIGSRDGLRRVVASWPEVAEALATRFWPGPLTLVLPRHPRLSPAVTAGRDSVGVRMPDHPALLAWLRACAFPLAVTSANLSGQPPAVTTDDLTPELLTAVGLVLDGGRCPGGRPSTVVDLSGESARVLRAGPVSEEEIRRCLAPAA